MNSSIAELSFLLRQCPSMNLRQAITKDIHSFPTDDGCHFYTWEDLVRNPSVHYGEILTVIRKLTLLYPRVAWLRLFYARALLDRFPDRAVQEAITATRLSPEYALAYKMLGDLYVLTEEPERALIAYQESIRLCPELAAAQVGRCAAFLLLADKAQDEEKLAYYEKAVKCVQEAAA